jgi:hypothetical protein
VLVGPAIDDTPVRLAVDTLRPHDAVFVALDMAAAKRWHADTSGRLGDLHPPGEALSPGLHRLVAFVRGEDQQVVRTDDASLALHVLWFTIGPSPSEPPPVVSLFVASPQGSYGGSARASRVPLGVHVLGERSGHSLLLRVRGPGADPARSHVLAPGQPYVLENLADGDYTLHVQLVDELSRPLGGSWTRAERTIVLNGDAPDDSTMVSSPTDLLPSALP